MTNALNLLAPVDTLAIDYTRDFDAPVSAVFRAHSDPDLVKQWIGPSRNEMTIERWDFHTVRDDEFVIQTFEFELAPEMVNIEFMWFEDLGGGRSRLRRRSICPSIEARDGLLSSPMESGLTEGYDRLEALVTS